MSARSFWPPVEAAQVDYEALRALALEPCGPLEGLARPGSPVVGWPG